MERLAIFAAIVALAFVMGCNLASAKSATNVENTHSDLFRVVSCRVVKDDSLAEGKRNLYVLENGSVHVEASNYKGLCGEFPLGEQFKAVHSMVCELSAYQANGTTQSTCLFVLEQKYKAHDADLEKDKQR